MRVCVCNCGSHIAVSFTHTLSIFLANFPPSSTIAHYSIARDTSFQSSDMTYPHAGKELRAT